MLLFFTEDCVYAKYFKKQLLWDFLKGDIKQKWLKDWKLAKGSVFKKPVFKKKNAVNQMLTTWQ